MENLDDLHYPPGLKEGNRCVRRRLKASFVGANNVKAPSLRYSLQSSEKHEILQGGVSPSSKIDDTSVEKRRFQDVVDDMHDSIISENISLNQRCAFPTLLEKV
jgi:hypothetical protein